MGGGEGAGDGPDNHDVTFCYATPNTTEYTTAI